MAAAGCGARARTLRAPGNVVLAAASRSLFFSASRPGGAQRLAEKLRKAKQEKEGKKAAAAVHLTSLQRRVRELVQYTRQLHRIHPNVLAKVLKDGILYQDKELVVIDKPYGLPVHGGPGIQRCITDVLPILAKMLDGFRAEPLHLCHRLDKETTGVMVLARSRDVAHQVQGQFKMRQVAKTYWAVCVGVPVHSEGVVDIPIVEKEVQSQQQHHKMTLAPNYHLEDGKMVKRRVSRDADSAVTQYRTLSGTTSCTLLELRPITGVKHQLRVHLAFGLGCPILGDHKYSNWNKLAPQKLPPVILKSLGLEQRKSRYIPLFLHAQRLTLPALGNRSRDLDLECPPSAFFERCLSRLGLEPPGRN
ncbi:mitochondrial RNA pseudouridine synthase RPUSD4 [Ornithorhynchus anatinus]|uniref:mitochondrial RNA pseudouridine synthase RPUSD4 n=1 Tax=Ornithorhynchus anatinus TaxID=9258 RepID=UPI0010A8863A|nr:mitochondrial RNA pseudouridine synthase RPUSD4 [Ornithorhynchus anatinus]